MKFIKFTEKYLDKFFEDNQIEDDNLFDFLKERTGVISEDTETVIDNAEVGDEYIVINIKLKMYTE